MENTAKLWCRMVLRLARRLRSVFFSDGLKIVVGVLMGSDKSVSHKIFVSFLI